MGEFCPTGPLVGPLLLHPSEDEQSPFAYRKLGAGAESASPSTGESGPYYYTWAGG